MYGISIIAAAVNLIFMAKLWLNKMVPLKRKAVWSLILLLIPGLGTVLYLGLFDPPPPLPIKLRGKIENDYVVGPAKDAINKALNLDHKE